MARTAAAGAGPAAEPVRTQTPNEELYAKSLEAAAQAVQVYGSWDNPQALERVARIGYRVAKEANYTDFPHFVLPGRHG